MGGDYTRFTFDPVRGFSGVFKQQGRVSLDANFNEFEEILDRHNRAQMYDTVGQAVVPVTTRHGFEILVDNAGKLTIGPGRAYVDGIQAECFGDISDPTATVRDDNIGGVHGGPVKYDSQPFFYSPNFPELSTTPGAFNLVYLDVWQREVTIYEEPALREPALNGADSDNRVQTAWQVKILSNQDLTADSCAKPPASWDALVAASTARLTAQATPTAPSPEPCVINPVGGYTGLENHLYRVEIHDAGTLGGGTPATFKWSRDNASLAATVMSITQVLPSWSTITVSSTGRDSWMRFEHGDHIELIDDWVELAMRESRTGGPMATVLSVNHATGEVLVDKDLSTFAIAAERHPRIRRWDAVTSTDPLVQPVNPGTAIPLEHGLTITFDGTATDTVQAGDHWVFAARTAEGTIDPPLVNEPPRGILHHFARLALAVTGQPNPQDCRNFWPPDFGGEGCCTVVVDPGEDIQQAINSLNGIGGCVCLKMGVHTIDRPLTINQTNLTLHGEVPLVTVQLSQGGPLMLDITGPTVSPGTEHNINVMGILFVAPDGRGPDPMIRVTKVNGGSIAHCGLRDAVTDPDVASRATGISLTDCGDFVTESTWLNGFSTGISGLRSNHIRVLDNTLIGLSRGQNTFATSLSAMGVIFQGDANHAPEGIVIERNIIWLFRRGIQIGEAIESLSSIRNEASIVILSFLGCRIASNLIFRGHSRTGQVSALSFAIAAHVVRCEIRENRMNMVELTDGGIIVRATNANVERNDIFSAAAFDAANLPSALPHGIVAYVSSDETLNCTVRGNYFTGLQQAIRAVGGTLANVFHHVDILENRIFGDTNFVQTIVTAAGSNPLAWPGFINKYNSVHVASMQHGQIGLNEIQDVVCAVLCSGATGVTAASNRIMGCPVGIVVGGGDQCQAADNMIEGVGPGQLAVLGILLLVAGHGLVRRNAISDAILGILSLGSTAPRIEDNTVVRGTLGIQLGLDLDALVSGNRVEDTTDTGIGAIAALHQLTVTNNLVSRCGYSSNPIAQGIAVSVMLGTANIDSCEVIDTGESANSSDPSFAGARFGVTVTLAGSARVHDCVIASPPLPKDAQGQTATLNSSSRAIHMTTTTRKVIGFTGGGLVIEGVPPFADASDNVAEQTADVLVEILTPGEIILAANRVTNLVDTETKVPSVDIYGSHITATGNRVRSAGGSPSFRASPLTAISAVGNVTTGGGTIVPAAGLIQSPHPYANFNANA